MPLTTLVCDPCSSTAFKAQKGTLMAGQTYDVKVNPAMDLTRTTFRSKRDSAMHGVFTNAESIRSINRDLPWKRNTRKVMALRRTVNRKKEW